MRVTRCVAAAAAVAACGFAAALVCGVGLPDRHEPQAKTVLEVSRELHGSPESVRMVRQLLDDPDGPREASAPSSACTVLR